jgi:hypothetical protein
MFTTRITKSPLSLLALTCLAGFIASAVCVQQANAWGDIPMPLEELAAPALEALPATGLLRLDLLRRPARPASARPPPGPGCRRPGGFARR